MHLCCKNKIMKTGGFENKYTDATVLQNAFKRVELTTENWQDYLELKEERLEDFDAFGESLGTYVICNYVGLKDPSVSRLSDDTVIRFTFTENYNYIDKYQDDGEIANEENYEWVQEVDISNFYHNSDYRGDELYYTESKGTGMYGGRETDSYATWTVDGLEVRLKVSCSCLSLPMMDLIGMNLI